MHGFMGKKRQGKENIPTEERLPFCLQREKSSDPQGADTAPISIGSVSNGIHAGDADVRMFV